MRSQRPAQVQHRPKQIKSKRLTVLKNRIQWRLRVIWPQRKPVTRSSLTPRATCCCLPVRLPRRSCLAMTDDWRLRRCMQLAIAMPFHQCHEPTIVIARRNDVAISGKPQQRTACAMTVLR
jgi:hypothetical protein